MSSLFETTCQKITPADSTTRKKATDRIASLTMPYWALGRILDVAVDICGITRSLSPQISRRTVIVMAGDHGVCESGVSAYPQEVTVEMAKNIALGGAGVNVLGRQANAKVVLVDIGVKGDMSSIADKIINARVANGTMNMSLGPAMTREQTLQAIEVGIQTVLEYADTTDIFATGDMGIGNTTPSSALVSVLCNLPVDSVTGTGTGIDEKQRKHKVAVIQKAIDINQPNPSDGFDVLMKVGGLEIAGLVGVILGAASLQKPVLIDGVISTAAALVAGTICPFAIDYMIMAHKSVEQGQAAVHVKFNKKPLLDLEFRLGEGTGAVMAIHLVEGGVRILTEMATFESAGVSGKVT